VQLPPAPLWSVPNGEVLKQSPPVFPATRVFDKVTHHGIEDERIPGNDLAQGGDGAAGLIGNAVDERQVIKLDVEGARRVGFP